MNDRQFHDWLRDPLRRPLVMGVLNVTPDSFSDGGRFFTPDAALVHAREMLDQGADLIDVGGESTRPGSQPVPPEEQLRRILPVISAIRQNAPVALSIDTTSSHVAQVTLDHGATLVNDISAGCNDPAMLPLVARCRAPIILMHMLGQPATMQQNPTYKDVTAEVTDYLRQRAAAARAAGVEPENILLDPGIGFGKTVAHNLELLRRTGELAALGHPLVIGPSRKRFIAAVTGQSDPEARVFGTAAAVAWVVANVPAIVRVHDVGSTTQVVRMTQAIKEGLEHPARPENS